MCRGVLSHPVFSAIRCLFAHEPLHKSRSHLYLLMAAQFLTHHFQCLNDLMLDNSHAEM
jgi:hypothetical protein